MVPKLQIYCRVPARWGLQQITHAADSNKTRGQGSFGPFTGGHFNITSLGIATYRKLKKRTDRTFDPFY